MNSNAPGTGVPGTVGTGTGPGTGTGTGTGTGPGPGPAVTLRAVADADLDALYDQMRDRQAVWMAAFTADDPDDRAGFDAHFVRLRTSPYVVLRAVEADGVLAGTIASFVVAGDTEITYWIDRKQWGRGVASRALASFLRMQTVRPMYARAAADNHGSLRVLQKAGFRIIGTETPYANARDAVIEETLLRLDGQA
ncbi:GNAT family N-acetyltransferase [Mangrovihabitans endophyticus]|uniref:N-acetyltransferase n=1 Tax=Mangrovihabitans endophyticus TaxID=1751298 RepID=A0A8J3FPE2_9ACTN|nr:GNAT family N-acetyltransferase [Mangrovihabitans endophyticus]GGL00580.1 N-acetyltransferase [Mangrovihabitans endophyticus]